jgi:hypothetical protein
LSWEAGASPASAGGVDFFFLSAATIAAAGRDADCDGSSGDADGGGPAVLASSAAAHRPSVSDEDSAERGRHGDGHGG